MNHRLPIARMACLEAGMQTYAWAPCLSATRKAKSGNARWRKPLATRASRLDRDGRDWHHLVDLRALTGALAVDPDGTAIPA